MGLFAILDSVSPSYLPYVHLLMNIFTRTRLQKLKKFLLQFKRYFTDLLLKERKLLNIYNRYGSFCPIRSTSIMNVFGINIYTILSIIYIKQTFVSLLFNITTISCLFFSHCATFLFQLILVFFICQFYLSHASFNLRHSVPHFFESTMDY